MRPTSSLFFCVAYIWSLSFFWSSYSLLHLSDYFTRFHVDAYEKSDLFDFANFSLTELKIDNKNTVERNYVYPRSPHARL